MILISIKTYLPIISNLKFINSYNFNELPIQICIRHIYISLIYNNIYFSVHGIQKFLVSENYKTSINHYALRHKYNVSIYKLWYS